MTMRKTDNPAAAGRATYPARVEAARRLLAALARRLTRKQRGALLEALEQLHRKPPYRKPRQAATLTDARNARIRRLHADGVRVSDLAEHFGLSRHMIGTIVRGDGR